MIDNQDSISKSLEVFEKAMEKAWEMWRMGLTSFTAAQEQVENMVKQQLDQSITARSEFFKMENDVQQQIRSNQEQLQKMVEEAVDKAYSRADQANQDMVAALTAQVDILMSQIKQNQDQMHNMIKETVLNTFLQSEKNQYNAISGLTNQVEDLSKKLINMSSQIQKINKKTDQDQPS